MDCAFPRGTCEGRSEAMSTEASAHDCVRRINALLTESNTQIETALSFSNPTRELIRVATCKRDTNKRGKPVAFFASFCPFCGVSLAREQP
jgi:hypothetical protein